MMKILTASNPRYSNAANTTIDLDVVTVEFGEIPFTASNGDIEAHGRDLYDRAIAGEFGAIAAYVTPIPTQAQINEAADAAIYKLFKDNIPDLMDALEAAAVGPAKAKIATINAQIKIEAAKRA